MYVSEKFKIYVVTSVSTNGKKYTYETHKNDENPVTETRQVHF